MGDHKNMHLHTYRKIKKCFPDMYGKKHWIYSIGQWPLIQFFTWTGKHRTSNEERTLKKIVAREQCIHQCTSFPHKFNIFFSFLNCFIFQYLQLSLCFKMLCLVSLYSLSETQQEGKCIFIVSHSELKVACFCHFWARSEFMIGPSKRESGVGRRSLCR